MKSKYIAPLLLALMMSPLVLRAASHFSENVTLTDTLTVGGTQLPAGTYRVQWDGTGAVTATLNQGKKVVASVPATVVDTKSNYDGAIDTQGKALQGIQWKNKTIQFNQGEAAASAAK